MDFLSNITSSISGNIDKALLCVKKPALAQPSGKTGAGQGSPISNVELRKSLLDAKKSFISSFSAVKEKANAGGYHVMQVKYNPSKLKLSGKAEGKMAPGAGGAAANMQIRALLPADTFLQVELLFDDENHQDAFLLEKATDLSAGGMVSDVAGVVRNIKDGGYSVRWQIEGLVGLITQSETRQVVFYWGNTIFAGIVTEIQAKYTMFNPIGDPVRGRVTLTIHQGGYDANNKGDDAHWNTAFEELLKQKELRGKVTGAVGNLINLN